MRKNYEKWYSLEKQKKSDYLYEKLSAIYTGKEVIIEQSEENTKKIPPELEKYVQSKDPKDFKEAIRNIVKNRYSVAGVVDTNAKGKRAIDAATNMFWKRTINKSEPLFPLLLESFKTYLLFVYSENKYFAKEFSLSKIKSGATGQSLKGAAKEYMKDADYGEFARSAKQGWVDLKKGISNLFNEAKDEEALNMLKEALLFEGAQFLPATLAGWVGLIFSMVVSIVGIITSVGWLWAQFPLMVAAHDGSKAVADQVQDKDTQKNIRETVKGIGELGGGLGTLAGDEGLGGAAREAAPGVKGVGTAISDILTTVTSLTTAGKAWVQSVLPANTNLTQSDIDDCSLFRKNFRPIIYNPNDEYDVDNDNVVLELSKDQGEFQAGFYVFKRGTPVKIRDYTNCR